ncbi:hypothetical protein C8R47DRAFT_971639 [Mycena vitilis]|nr:hypothetical protein C8R47DRAFT_971639 [Mycena vitilis]
MPKSTAKPGATRARAPRKSKAATAPASSLKTKKAEIRDQFGNAANTKSAYKGYLDRGHVILADIVADREKQETQSPGSSLSDDIDIELLAKAFTGPPNKHSVYALELYLTQKCVVESLGKSTAEGIQGAFAKYWDELPGGHYTGAYMYDQETEKVRGNPARAPEVLGFVKCIKNKARVKGAAATRHHAEATTTIEDMQGMMQWSESQCPAQKLQQKPVNVKDLLTMIKHGMTRAFLSSGHVLWTRCSGFILLNFETCQIQERDLSAGHGPSPHYMPYLGVFLDNRKGWQKKQGYDGPLESNHYEIYEQKDSPEIDMFTHVARWRTLYRQLLGREFEPDDYLFPYVSPNGNIHSKKPMSHDAAQELIDEFALGAKINKKFTTHCLRRGGAQYRFMFAPIGKRWSLSIIRWWGGWAVGEQVDTLMRYLLDSLQSYESGHGNALYPFCTEPDKSFMGDHNAMQPPTTAEFRALGEQIMSKLSGLAAQTPPQLLVAAIAALVQQTSLSPNEGSPSHPTFFLSPRAPHAPHACVPVLGGTTHVPVLGGSTHLRMQSDSLPQMPDGSDSSDTVIPIAGAIIPGVGKDSQAWKRAIDQWYLGDPGKGLTVALKDWPTHWYTGAMRLKTGTLYSNRKLLAEEYER